MYRLTVHFCSYTNKASPYRNRISWFKTSKLPPKLFRRSSTIHSTHGSCTDRTARATEAKSAF